MSCSERIDAAVGKSRIGVRSAAGLVLIVIAGAVMVLIFEIENFSSTALENTIREWGAWGVIGSIGFMVLHSFVPFPAEFLAIANGMVYGPVWGTVITWAGAMLGAFAAFGLARVFGRPLVEFAVAKRNWNRLDDWTEAQGWRLVFVSRFIPVIAFNLVNYAAGLARISWWTFAWSTGVGILPMTVMMVLIGSSAQFIAWEIWAFAVVIAAFVWLVIWRKYLRNYFSSNTRILPAVRNVTETRMREENEA